MLAYDEETGEQAYKPVVQLFRNESKDWVGVTVNGKEIISTPGHKYYLPETKAWVSAEDLKVGYKVLTSDGEYATIEAVRPIHYKTPQTTYNFEVADFHTYYVGTGVLVHNKNCGFGKYKDGMKMTEDEALDAAQDFLGEGYREVSADRFVSADGMRQVRMSPKDLAVVNNHAGSPHLNFDVLRPKYKSIHIFIKGLK